MTKPNSYDPPDVFGNLDQDFVEDELAITRLHSRGLLTARTADRARHKLQDRILDRAGQKWDKARQHKGGHQ